MLSDYINSFQGCATVPPEINALPNDMGIPNGEVILFSPCEEFLEYG